MKAITSLFVALLGCACASQDPPEPTLTLVVDGAHRTALGPLRQADPRGHCVNGAWFGARSEHVALGVCVPDTGEAPRAYISWYGVAPSRHPIGWHRASTDDLKIVRAGDHAFLRMNTTVVAPYIGNPASFTGLQDSVTIELLGETALVE